MSKTIKNLLIGLKYTVYLFIGSAAGGFTYLQYINSQLGPLQIDPQQCQKHYQQQFKMSPQQAKKMYFWLTFDIGMFRIINYHRYSSYCDKLRSKLVTQTLNNYQQEHIFEAIQQCTGGNNKQRAEIFARINKIRDVNFGNIQTYEYIVKEIRRLTRMLNSYKIVGLSSEEQQKIDTLHTFLCKVGQEVKDKSIVKYVKQLQNIDKLFPGDYLHKILVI